MKPAQARVLRIFLDATRFLAYRTDDIHHHRPDPADRLHHAHRPAKHTRDELEKSSRQIENGRYAMQLLHDDIEHAGYYGLFSPDSALAATLPSDPCVITPGATNSGWSTNPLNSPVPIYGYQGAPTHPLAPTACGPAMPNYMPTRQS